MFLANLADTIFQVICGWWQETSSTNQDFMEGGKVLGISAQMDTLQWSYRGVNFVMTGICDGNVPEKWWNLMSGWSNSILHFWNQWRVVKQIQAAIPQRILPQCNGWICLQFFGLSFKLEDEPSQLNHTLSREGGKFRALQRIRIKAGWLQGSRYFLGCSLLITRILGKECEQTNLPTWHQPPKRWGLTLRFVNYCILDPDLWYI